MERSGCGRPDDGRRRRFDRGSSVARRPGAGRVPERVRSTERVPDHRAGRAAVRAFRVPVGRGRAGRVHETLARRGRHCGTAGGGDRGPNDRRGTTHRQSGEGRLLLAHGTRA